MKQNEVNQILIYPFFLAINSTLTKILCLTHNINWSNSLANLFFCKVIPIQSFVHQLKRTCFSKSTFESELGVRNTCSITGSVSWADLPNPVLSVGTERQPRTLWPRDSATLSKKQSSIVSRRPNHYKDNSKRNAIQIQCSKKKLHGVLR